jgi:starch-binding outer membrane protein, SusD/RagB family
LNENGKTGDALGYLNQIRTRAGLAGYSGLTQDDTREKIYKERRVELGMEGHRWFDLLRTGRAYDSLQSSGMKQYMTVFPVPLSEVQLVNDASLFPQNSGYN